MNESYVYMLVDPRNNQPFYVGKGRGNRCRFHLDEAKYYTKRKSLKLNKIRKLFSLGMEPTIIKVEENVTDAQAIDLEVLLIAEMRDIGIPLTNMTDGGDGAQGYKHSEAHKQHASKSQIGRIFSEETKQKMRKPRTEEAKASMAKARLSMTYRPTAEHKRRLSESLLGRPSPMRGKTQSAEARAKMSEQRKGIPKPKIECPHCHKLVAVNTAKRWHFDNCKDKE